MRLVTKETDYAIRALLSLARTRDAFVPSAGLSAADGIPLQFLRRILQRLIRAGLVTSREGVAGGIRLARDPSRIKVLDVMRLFQGEVQVSECMFRRKLCANRGTCVLRKRLNTIGGILAREFARISIADLLRDADRQAGMVARRHSRPIRRRAATRMAAERGAR